MAVISSEPLGANTLLHGKLKGSDAVFTASLAGVHRFVKDSAPIRLSMDASNVPVFDRKTGLRLVEPPQKTAGFLDWRRVVVCFGCRKRWISGQEGTGSF